jgi:hypothetical protein
MLLQLISKHLVHAIHTVREFVPRNCAGACAASRMTQVVSSNNTVLYVIVFIVINVCLSLCVTLED